MGTKIVLQSSPGWKLFANFDCEEKYKIVGGFWLCIVVVVRG